MRHQLAGYSPLRLGGILRAATEALTRPSRGHEELADLLKEELGECRVRFLDSGTHALQVALDAARKGGPGSELRVALPAYSCFDLATAAVAVGARVAFYDVEPDSLRPELHSLARAARGADAVVAANLYGFPLDWAAIREVVDGPGTVLIEDAAQGLGSSWNGAPSGSLGDLTILSFGRGKGWTGGLGGALLDRRPAAGADSPGSAAPDPDALPAGLTGPLMKLLAQWTLGRPALYGVPAALPGLGLGETRYKAPTAPGPMPLSASRCLVRHRLDVRREVKARIRRAGEYRSRLTSAAGGSPGMALCTPESGGTASYLRFPLRCRGPGQASRMARRLRRLGVTRGYPTPLHRLDAIQPFLDPAHQVELPGSEALASSLVLLPTHSLVSESDMDRITGHIVAEGTSGLPDMPA